MAQSEVARIRAQIEAECEGFKRGLQGYAITAKHQFIHARYERLGQLQDDLARHVGEHEAMQQVVALYIKVVGGDEKGGAKATDEQE
jgi:hypothetical protein